MMLKKNLAVFMILTIFLAACSSVKDPIGYPGPEVLTNPYPNPEASPGVENGGGLNPEIYPAPGKPTMFDPLPEDSGLERSEVQLVSESIQVILDASPVVFVRLTVQVVDLCQQVRVVVQPPQEGKIAMEVYSVADSSAECAQMINSIVPTVTLGALQPGSYELMINGEAATTFEVK